MLKDVYIQVGMGGTLLVGMIALLTVMSWFVAVAGTVVRPMSAGRRVALLGLLAFVPPTAPVILFRFIAAAKNEYSRVRSTMPVAAPDAQVASAVTIGRLSTR